VLDYTVDNNDKLNPANLLTLGSAGSTVGLTILGHPSAPFTQVVNGLTLAGAANTVAMSGTTTLSLGTINRAVGVGALAIANTGSGAIGTTSGSASTILTNANGLAFATYNGDWAAKDAGNANIVAGASLGGFYTADTWAAGNNTDVTGSSAPSSGSTTRSLRFNTAGASTITLSGTNSITSGGILVTPNVGANLTKITGGSMSQPTGGNNGEIMVIQNNTSGDLQIDTAIVNTSGRMSLNKTGPGKLILSTNCSMTGYIYLNAGTLQFGDGIMTGTMTPLGAGSSCMSLQNGTVVRVAGGAGGLSVVVSGTTVGGNGTAVLDVTSNSVLSLPGISGANWEKRGTGTFILGPNAGFTYGWVREGTFVVNVPGATIYSINGGATIGDTAPGALPATVFLQTAIRVDQFGTATTYINRSGTLDFYTNSINLGVSPTFVGGGTVISSAGAPGTATLTGNVTYNATNSSDVGATISVVPLVLGTAGRTFTINDSAYVDTEMTISSDISGTQAVTKAGTGAMAFSGNNSYTGTTTVSAGTLVIKKPASLPNYNVNSRIIVSAAATLALNAGGAGEWVAAEIDALRGTTPSPFAANSFLGIDTTGGNFTYGSSFGDGAGALGLRKLGTNTLTLTQANTYTGGTRIEKGTLVASNANALSTSGTITAYSNAMLGVASGVTFSRSVTFNAGSGLTGNGTFAGGLTCPASFTVAPGLPTGTLTVNGALTLAANNTLRVAFQPDGTYGKLSVTGTLNMSDATVRLVLTGKAPMGKTVLAEGTTLTGQFREANVDMSGLSPKGIIKYENNQVVLAVYTPGAILKVY
jgi:autotransporter-associated beta strand protein